MTASPRQGNWELAGGPQLLHDGKMRPPHSCHDRASNSDVSIQSPARYQLRHRASPNHFRLISAIFDFQFIQISDTLRSSPVVLHSSENMGITGGISLLSCIIAEMIVLLNLFPLNGSHVWFTSHPDVGEYLY